MRKISPFRYPVVVLMFLIVSIICVGAGLGQGFDYAIWIGYPVAAIAVICEIMHRVVEEWQRWVDDRKAIREASRLLQDESEH